MKQTVLAGIRATSKLHIGNYLGAVKGMLELEKSGEYETFFMVADIHAITTPFDPEGLRKNKYEVVIDYLACGLDPEKSVIFLQSMVGEHAEFAFYLSSLVTIARMQHLPTFKEKVKQYPESTSLALLNYPTLMASDILLYNASKVPVGIDQEPHLEIAREIARKLNSTYSLAFNEATRFATEGQYVPSLTGEGKMSKSVEGSAIMLTDDFETIKNKLFAVPTDSGKGEGVPISGGVKTLLELTTLFLGVEKRKEYELMYLSDGIKYKQMKEELAEEVYKVLIPIQEKRRYFENNPQIVVEVINYGKNKAQKVASENLAKVKFAMGL
ncbi:MAG: tryptophan--tRNA ligase [bacterium]|nr:tryptophan--tRNA ligase [bacterium]